MANAGHVDERAPGDVVGMLRGLAEAEDGRDTRIDTREVRGPLVTRPGEEHRGEARAELRPPGAVVAVGDVSDREPEPVEERGVELRLERADRDVPSVGALVHVVEGCTAVEHVGASLLAPEPEV